MKKVLIVLLALVLIGIQSVAACTIFAVGKNATTDGSTMISHTCDSNSDDLRLWLIPAQEPGFTRDIVKSGRAGSDFSNFPEIIYGSRATVMGEYTAENGTNAYVQLPMKLTRRGKPRFCTRWISARAFTRRSVLI